MGHSDNSSDAIVISLEKARLDVAFVHAFLTTSSWAAGISLARVSTSIDHSLCAGAYLGTQQVGFARLVTDFATFGYLCDVFVDSHHRGQGLGKRLTLALLNSPEVNGSEVNCPEVNCPGEHSTEVAPLRRILLATSSASWLYEGLGFTPVNQPNYLWQRYRPDAYSEPGRR
ncbi:GNAT family N-acetyltransferase [Halomonas sp. DP8Y7-3]|uniref:GNAT family N-acetyltransferase n=1 Tax=Halomonas sp. DP8Y7-3 TaxID=2859079 RepID=UPI001C93DC63|nr:GNAT family N-acetyltransferase [Halomonas sp. DP8Y7-3]MBY5930696.1 GNAT family N-acetyltransferase [Halomonas sp. DP8Y7-3]